MNAMAHDPVLADLARYEARESRQAQRDLLEEAAYLNFQKWNNAEDAIAFLREASMSGVEKKAIVELAARVYARQYVEGNAD